jgi:lysophospholipase L1-like esterase
MMLFFSTCTNDGRVKLVAIGDSLTMGIQDAGLVKDYQLHSYPYLIATQMGLGTYFEQPYVTAPGFGSPPYAEPLKLEDGQIVSTYMEENPGALALLLRYLPRLENFSLARPYDNLGVGGAWLHDVRRTTSQSNAVLPGNYLFDMVLRNSFNPDFGDTTMLQQAVSLNPTIILLWIGNNDILRAVMEGGDPSQITDETEFRNEFTALLSDLQDQTEAAVFVANIPEHLAFTHILDDIFQPVSGYQGGVAVPVLFDPDTVLPFNFGDAGDPVYVPILTAEGDIDDPVEYFVQEAIEGYLERGIGIPDAEDLETLGVASSPTEADALFEDIEFALTAAGVTIGPDVGTPFTGDYTITQSEFAEILDAVGAFNVILQDAASQFGVPLVDINQLWDPETEGAFYGYSGEFVMDDPEHTIFSLDGVHPNNLGHAVVANAFIEEINRELGMSIPALNLEDYEGQYVPYMGMGLQKDSIRAISGVGQFFVP